MGSSLAVSARRPAGWWGLCTGLCLAVALAGCTETSRVTDAEHLEPAEDAAPDFALRDVNPNSATYAVVRSPRDYLGMTTAWYFGFST